MFVPHARVHISGKPHLRGKLTTKARQQSKLTRRRVGVKEFLRMPCLLPALFVVFIGLLVLAGGAGMCVLGYVPETATLTAAEGGSSNSNNFVPTTTTPDPHNTDTNPISHHQLSTANATTVTATTPPRDVGYYYATKSLSYVGPILMGCGFFAIIVSCVLYCEIVDRYAVLLPSKPDTRLKRRQLLEMILGEFKKSYFRGIEVPLRRQEEPDVGAGARTGGRQMETLLKALSISTPVLLMSPDLAPSCRFPYLSSRLHPHPQHHHHRFALKPRHPKLKQLGGSGSSGHEPWLKTSSLPNICDPELRRHNHVLPRPVPLGQPVRREVGAGAAPPAQTGGTAAGGGGRQRRLKRFGRPSRSMENRISWSLPQTLSRSATGVDNPAYLHEQDRKKSVSMCVHQASYHAGLRRPQITRFIKASRLQPRVRLQQQHTQSQQQPQQQQQKQQLPSQHQQFHKLLQGQSQSHQSQDHCHPHHYQQHHHHHQQEQQQRKLVHQHSSRDSSEEGTTRRRADSDGAGRRSRSGSSARQRPKLVRTKGSHKSFESSGDSFSGLPLPAEPPPFPLPAHFLTGTSRPQLDRNCLSVAQEPSSSLHAVSPRTAKLLKAKCKSEDVRDRKRSDVMLLKDLFRSVDVPDDAAATTAATATAPVLINQTSSTSMPCTVTGSSAEFAYLDPLAGQPCQKVPVNTQPFASMPT